MTFVKAFALLALAPALHAQFRGGPDWSTAGNDAQRSSWVRTDPKINPASVAGGGFQLVWKVKLGDSLPLSAPVLLDRYIGYRGFRTYAFVGGRGENAFALDSDLGRIEWRKHFTAPAAASGACAGAFAALLTRPVSAELPSVNAGRGGGFGGRGGPAHSGVGEPLEGAVTLAQVAAMRPPSPPTPAPGAPGAARPPAGFGRAPSWLYGLASDGALHSMYVSNGEEPEPPIPFLPAKANVAAFSVVEGVAYATTKGECGGIPDGVSALDLATKSVSHWKGAAAGSAELAFAPSAAYVTSQNELLELDPKSLAVKASYQASQPFTTAPLVFESGAQLLIAGATKDGVVHLVASSAALAKSPAGSPNPTALATFLDAADTRWIVASGAKFIDAWKIVQQSGAPAFQTGWSAHPVESPAPPLIINGVLFALDRGDRGRHAVLYAFNASTGKQLWTSGNTIASFVPASGGLAAGGSSLYFGTADGTLWAFSFPIEH